MKYVVVSVEGIIGAGKTTFINMLSKCLGKMGYRVTIVKEPVDRWEKSGILKLFYENPKRWAYHFQTKAFHDRIVENINAHEKYGDSTDIFILERSPYTDNLFMDVLWDDGIITELEYNDYKDWWSLWSKVMPYTINMIVFLRPNLDVCMARCKERSRNGEAGISKDYQAKLLAKHDQFMNGNQVATGDGHYVPCVKLESDENFRDDESVQNRLTEYMHSVLTTITNIKKVTVT